jgi:hypothetical protein
MIKKDEIADPHSCLNKSADGEPLFVLCARDPYAADLVDLWADRYIRIHQWECTDTQHVKDKAEEAHEIAEQMRDYRLGVKK